MFESENEGFGINSYNAMCEDPQCSNAINTEILSHLKEIKFKGSKEYEESVKKMVDQLSKQNFNQRLKENLETILQGELELF